MMLILILGVESNYYLMQDVPTNKGIIAIINMYLMLDIVVKHLTLQYTVNDKTCYMANTLNVCLPRC